MQLGSKGKALIQGFEQLRSLAYRDGRGIWTCGWGHTGPNIVAGVTCTKEQADLWFDADTKAATLGVIRSLDVELTQNQFDALVSFAFNVGVGAEAHSTMLKLINAGKLREAAEEFGKWNHINGVVSDGLSRRRAAERELFLSPDVAPVPALH